jgi:hypothetical protein
LRLAGRGRLHWRGADLAVGVGAPLPTRGRSCGEERSLRLALAWPAPLPTRGRLCGEERSLRGWAAPLPTRDILLTCQLFEFQIDILCERSVFLNLGYALSLRRTANYFLVTPPTSARARARARGKTRERSVFLNLGYALSLRRTAYYFLVTPPNVAAGVDHRNDPSFAHPSDLSMSQTTSSSFWPLASTLVRPVGSHW